MINFSDVAFLIPIRFDSDARIRNVNYVLRYILSRFSTNIFLYEEDITPKAFDYLDGDLLNQCHYSFFQNNEASRCFRKAKLLNQMSIDSRSSILIFQDSDCFLDSDDAYIEAVNFIRNKEYDFVYPHNRCPRYDVECFSFFETGDIEKLKFIRQTTNNTGGISVINTDAFLKMGMWNEFFESWGKEDDDFYRRCVKIELRIKRIGTALIHLNHEQESGDGFYTKVNSKQSEIDRIWRMSKEELQKELSNWPWVLRLKAVVEEKKND